MIDSESKLEWTNTTRGPRIWLTQLFSKLEAAPSSVALALVGILAFGWVLLKVLLPVWAPALAQHTPVGVEKLIAQQYTSFLKDMSFIRDSTIDDGAKAWFESVRQEVEREFPGVHIELIRGDSSLGANAFAICDGKIFVTDQLVELTNDRDELIGILLHEVGHLKHRHLLQALIQKSAISGFLSLLLNDINGTALLIAMATTSYSREMEHEADAFASTMMIQRGKDPRKLGKVLALLTAKNGHSSTSKSDVAGVFGKLYDFFSSHPPVSERLHNFEEFAARAQWK
jgi:Zn-dependent protease with chaperone function